MYFLEETRREYFMQRAYGGCTACGTLEREVNPISALCRCCVSRYNSNGSPTIKKPDLEQELEKALFKVIARCDLRQATKRFDEWMLGFASPVKTNSLQRLCWLHYYELKGEDGEPLLDFKQALVQAVAVTMYDRANGELDHKRKQLNYLLGRSVCTIWNKKRQVADGLVYDRWERWKLQRKPRLMHEAFTEIYLKAGISRFIAKLNNRKTD